MFSLSTAFFATLLTGATASQQPLAGYTPQTNVADHAAGISQDQKALFDFVGFDSEVSFQGARDIYQLGGNSKSYGDITLDAPLALNIKKGAGMTYVKSDGTVIYGTAYANYAEGSPNVGFKYPTGESYTQHSYCKVGGLPEELHVLSGCIPMDMDGGIVSIVGIGDVAFTSVNNINGRTIQGMSRESGSKFRPAADMNKPFFSFYEPYVAYYGTPTFGDEIVSAGLSGTDTNMNNGNLHLEKYSFEARAEIVRHGAASINVGQYVMRELWDSITDCGERVNCVTAECNDDTVHGLDEAVAFYVGGEFVTDVRREGNLYYGLAEQRAYNFATAEEGIFGVAEVNRKVLVEFRDMKKKLIARQCDAAKENADEIARLMYVPLIQGALQFTYLNSIANVRNQDNMAEGAIFAAAILPIVHSCNEAAAQTIYENVQMGKTPSSNAYDFEAVKNAFESVYGCMNIQCSDIGGLVNTGTAVPSYFEKARPCGGYNSLNGPVLSTSSGSDGLSNGAIYGILISVLAVVLIIGLVVVTCMCRRGGKETQSKEDDPDILPSFSTIDSKVETTKDVDLKVEDAEYT